jgi:hypothetical protein
MGDRKDNLLAGNQGPLQERFLDEGLGSFEYGAV